SSRTANWSAANRVASPSLSLGSGGGFRHILQLPDPLRHFPPGLEGDDQFGRDLYAFAGVRVACLPGLALLDLKHPEIAKLDAAFLQQRLRDTVKYTLDDLLSLQLGEARPVGDGLGHVFLGHEQPSLLARHSFAPVRLRTEPGCGNALLSLPRL